MKGYKGMTKDMTCRGMPFEIGESYHIEGNVTLCRNGLHFCEKLTDVFEFYHPDESRFFEIVANGDINTDGKKSAASDITIVRELTAKEINRARYGDGDGYGNGYGYGDGYGNGNGNGNGDGYGRNIQRILIFNT